MYHKKKILILSGILSFQIGHFRGMMPFLMMAMYIDRVENTPLLCRSQMKTSLALVRLIVKTFATRLHHASNSLFVWLVADGWC
jgi:hypothetical protein